MEFLLSLLHLCICLFYLLPLVMSQSQCELSLGGPGVFSVPIGNVSLDASITARGVLVTIGERRFSSDEDGQRLAFEVNGYGDQNNLIHFSAC